MEEEIKESGRYGATGSAANLSNFIIIKYPFGKYELTLKLSSNNEFLDILETYIPHEKEGEFRYLFRPPIYRSTIG